MSESPEDRFSALYSAHFRDLLGFALRRTERPEDAADVVSDTFVVAWRRIDKVPLGSEARLWLYGVCRRTLANHTRGGNRRDRLGARLRDTLAETVVPDHGDAVASNLTVTAALGRLSDADRELLQLTIWEKLEPREVASVLGIPARTVRTRLSRARSRLRDELDGDAEAPAGHVLHDRGAAQSLHPTLARREGR